MHILHLMRQLFLQLNGITASLSSRGRAKLSKQKQNILAFGLKWLFIFLPGDMNLWVTS